MVDLILPRRAARTPSSPQKSASTHKTEASAAARQRIQPPSQDNITEKISKTIKGANDLLLYWKDGLSADERALLRKREERKQVLTLRMKSAETLQHWQNAAEELDLLEGNDEWKRDFSDGDYNPCLIEERLTALEEARSNGDLLTMMHLIRTELSRDLGGMGNVDLYRHSYLGTKRLIERYVDSALRTIDAVVIHGGVGGPAAPPPRDLLEGMLLARQSFGRSALLLSGGGTFGMSHIGVLKTLFEARLLPRIISGASAGSIVCAVLCTRTDEEIPALLRDFPHGDLAVFGDAEESRGGAPGALAHIRRLLTEGSWSDTKHLTRVVRSMTGDMTFQEAYNRTRRILNICVSTESVYELPRLLNYVTAPNVMIWSAVTASCSLPFVFRSSPLLVKDPVTGAHRRWNPSPQHFIDGSVDNDLPMTRLAEMFNVNHFIVSQVNPHVVPFLAKDDHLSPEDKQLRKARQRGGAASSAAALPNESDLLNTFTTLARDEALHRLQFMAEMGVFPNLMTKCQSILSQKYSGDITILPEIGLGELPGLLSNPSAEFMLRSSIAGERATWPKLSRIRDRCAIELALDNAVHRLRTRVVFSESQGDLRKLGADTAVGTTTPIAATGGSDTPAGGGVQQQHRRRSGGCLRSLGGDHRSSTFPPIVAGGDVTDDDTLEEERLEMRSRRSRGSSPATARVKPRLHRASKSQMHITRPSTGLSATPSLRGNSNPFAEFDFSKPLALPSDAAQPKADSAAAAMTPYVNSSEEDEPEPEPPRSSWLPQRPAQQQQQPIEDVETSEQGHSSDADIDQASEESDPDPYDSKWESPPPEYCEAVKDDSMFGPGGRVGDGAWE
ncbi:Acyl transferase/acyl hydrolase/lysophospholipase [Cordyceps fumosorosea ARSEF 2679]|uniref:Patatin-like phospholipase domain-containing protein n=1 Tax=Cordyceps fumosorosea (strain ARSEF 2679) TaxID=1081104 RepID=A0A168ED08_CORFA|nr:Acyl transferase/acyl hydrolase/lysophospholipase [Cordyceps fumosorosea ARSEF 2679]OAA73666.1 Acyl transferase/acyl hydrolase/lysophospholipase [Cordyceps fumosorosea ARSEF 2679]